MVVGVEVFLSSKIGCGKWLGAEHITIECCRLFDVSRDETSVSELRIVSREL